MKRILSFVLVLLVSMGLMARSQRQTVVLDVDLHCQGCITKIEKNIAFEPGVKDLRCNLDEKTVTVVFDPQKTDINRLLEAFAKINKPAKVHPTPSADTEPEQSSQEETDAQTGASTPQ